MCKYIYYFKGKHVIFERSGNTDTFYIYYIYIYINVINLSAVYVGYIGFSTTRVQKLFLVCDIGFIIPMTKS